MKEKRGPKHNHPKKSMRIAGAAELDLPKSDELNIWDETFGWILKNGKPTLNTKAYWEAQRRKPKQ